MRMGQISRSSGLHVRFLSPSYEFDLLTRTMGRRLDMDEAGLVR